MPFFSAARLLLFVRGTIKSQFTLCTVIETTNTWGQTLTAFRHGPQLNTSMNIEALVLYLGHGLTALIVSTPESRPFSHALGKCEKERGSGKYGRICAWNAGAAHHEPYIKIIPYTSVNRACGDKHARLSGAISR